MQVDRARALRSEEGTVVENCSLSRRVARVAANGESGGEGVRGASAMKASSISFYRIFPLAESNRLLRVGGHMQPRGAT